MSPVTKKHNPVIRTLTRPFKFIYKKVAPISYVKKEYRYITGHKLNLDKPTRYTEKLQYLRLFVYSYDELVSKCASKLGLREYALEKGYKDNLINNYGVFDRFDDINFDILPSKFIMKCTHACGFNYICYDKETLDINKLRKTFNKWLKTNYGNMTIEKHYSPIKPQIVIEDLLLEDNELPIEYKIHVFNGKAKYMYVVTGRNNDIRYNNFYIDWKEFNRAQFNHWKEDPTFNKKPLLWDEAVKLAESLAKPFPFVRVDLYIIANHIYISEMTFTPAKGTLTFRDDKVDYEIGEWLDIKK